MPLWCLLFWLLLHPYLSVPLQNRVSEARNSRWAISRFRQTEPCFLIKCFRQTDEFLWSPTVSIAEVEGSEILACTSIFTHADELEAARAFFINEKDISVRLRTEHLNVPPISKFRNVAVAKITLIDISYLTAVVTWLEHKLITNKYHYVRLRDAMHASEQINTTGIPGYIWSRAFYHGDALHEKYFPRQMTDNYGQQVKRGLCNKNEGEKDASLQIQQEQKVLGSQEVQFHGKLVRGRWGQQPGIRFDGAWGHKARLIWYMDTRRWGDALLRLINCT